MDVVENIDKEALPGSSEDKPTLYQDPNDKQQSKGKDLTKSSSKPNTMKDSQKNSKKHH